MVIPHTNNRRFNSSESQNPNGQERCSHTNKAIYRQSPADSIMRITMIGAMILVLAMAVFTSAAHANAGEVTPAQVSQAPDKLVETTTEQMLAALKRDQGMIKKNPDHVYNLANEIVLPHFDFKYMSALALGKHWRRATPEQKQRFPEEFRSLLLRTYATALSEYTDEKVAYMPLRANASSGDVTVMTEIQRDGGPSIPVSYGLHKKDNAWKVYDIKIEGISLVANYRSTFASQIRRGGMDKLINKLASKNQRVASIR